MIEPPADEPELIRRAQNGDAEAFGCLYEHYVPPVFRFLFSHLGDRLDAEDLTEEVFFRLWRALPGYEVRQAPFGGFLFRVARNALYDHYRKTRRGAQSEALDEAHADAPERDPAAHIPENLERQELWSALDRLKKDHRLVLELRFLAGLTPEETAAAMGKSAGAVRVLQHRALRALKKWFQSSEQDLDDGP